MENKKNKIIFIGGDHASYDERERLQKYLTNLGYLVYDKGSYSKDPANYAEHAIKVAKGVQETPNSNGIVVCGSGIGVNIAANKVKNIKSILVYSKLTAKLANTKKYNVIALGSRFLTYKNLEKYVNIFLGIEN